MHFGMKQKLAKLMQALRYSFYRSRYSRRRLYLRLYRVPSTSVRGILRKRDRYSCRQCR
jgi:hypothetical protein